jgi:hypothetical protein
MKIAPAWLRARENAIKIRRAVRLPGQAEELWRHFSWISPADPHRRQS